jgi:hypothetical protein
VSTLGRVRNAILLCESVTRKEFRNSKNKEKKGIFIHNRR